MNLVNLTNGLVSTSQVLTTTTGVFGGCYIYANGDDEVTVTVYANDKASGDKIFERKTTNPYYEYFPINIGRVDKKCYLSISGTGAECQPYEWKE